MGSAHFTVFIVLVFTIFSFSQVHAANENYEQRIKPSSSPFASALETLQKQINYTFTSTGLLRRAMTHASFSEENNKALGILGTHVIETSVSLRSLGNNIEISPKDLNRRITEISNVESSCAVDGTRLGLQKIVRVSPKTDVSTLVVCGAFRAIFGAIAIDTENSDVAGRIFWSVHRGGGAFSSLQDAYHYET